MEISYTLIFNTGLFSDACQDWQRLTVNKHNGVNFKADFETAHHEWRDSQVKSKQAGYHNVNYAMELQQDTAIAIENLATATASGRSTL